MNKPELFDYPTIKNSNLKIIPFEKIRKVKVLAEKNMLYKLYLDEQDYKEFRVKKKRRK